MKTDVPSPFQKVLPGLGVGKDKLKLILHFYSEAIVMQDVDTKSGNFKIVSAHDIAQALSRELTFGSGLLPGDEKSMNALWWSNDKDGPVVALWIPPGVKRLALQKDLDKTERYDVPLPGLIFLCRPGLPPWVYAAHRRPAGPKDKAFKAPLANVYNNGNTCPGSHKYSSRIEDIPDGFFKSFFTRAADTNNRSKKHSQDITKLWKDLNGKKEFPLNDLIVHGTVGDLMAMKLQGRYW